MHFEVPMKISSITAAASVTTTTAAAAITTYCISLRLLYKNK